MALLVYIALVTYQRQVFYSHNDLMRLNYKTYNCETCYLFMFCNFSTNLLVNFNVSRTQARKVQFWYTDKYNFEKYSNKLQ